MTVMARTGTEQATPWDGLRSLEAAGAAAKDGFDIFETALILSKLDEPDLDLAPYRTQMDALVRTTEAARKNTRSDAEALAKAIGEEAGFHGDPDTYDDLANADLAAVMEKRTGLPVTLGIVYIAVGRRLQWTVSGLAFPGHFLIAAQGERGAVIMDPFRRGAVRSAEEMEALLRVVEGAQARIDAEVLRPVADRDVIQRVIANQEARSEDPERLAHLAIRRRRVSPGDAGLALAAASRANAVGWLAEAQEAFGAAVELSAGDDEATAQRAREGEESARRKLN